MFLLALKCRSGKCLVERELKCTASLKGENYFRTSLLFLHSKFPLISRVWIIYKWITCKTFLKLLLVIAYRCRNDLIPARESNFGYHTSDRCLLSWVFTMLSYLNPNHCLITYWSYFISQWRLILYLNFAVRLTCHSGSRNQVLTFISRFLVNICSDLTNPRICFRFRFTVS